MEDNEATQLRAVARDEANKALLEHLRLCPFSTFQVETRLRGLEISYARLIGFMGGSGLLGGAVGAAIVQAIGK